MTTPGGDPPAPSPGQSPQQPTPGHWITRWQTVLAAAVTAAGAVAVAVVTAAGPGGGAQAKTAAPTATAAAPPSSELATGQAAEPLPPASSRTNAQLSATINRTGFKVVPKLGRAIVVSGVIIGYREAVASNLDIPTYRVVIEPIGPPPFDQKDVTNAQVSPVGERRAGGEPSEWVYFSAPVAVEPDGTWETEVFIPAEDEREVNVYMAACSWRSLMGVTGSGEPPPSRTSEEPTLVVNQVISGKLHSSLRTK